MRSLSGVTATGNITIANYLGAIKEWVSAQETYEENFYFIPDLHTLNTRQDPALLQEGVVNTVAWMLAAGIDPDKSHIYLQSQIPAHSELCWILNNYVTMGELSRMTQYKEKSSKRDASGQVVGLFTYPILQAADILLYDAEVVPVGADQVQHIELTRDIAQRFNNLYGETFCEPKHQVNKVTSRIMDLQKPANKMSKSDPTDSLGALRMLDTQEVLRNKVMRAVTDSGGKIQNRISKPAISNLLKIYAGMGDISIEDLEDRYKGKSYGDFKKDLAELIINVLKPIQQNYKQIVTDKAQIFDILQQGKGKVEPLAQAKIIKVKQKIGLLTD